MAVYEPHWLTGEFPEVGYERHVDTGPRLDNSCVGAKVNLPERVEAGLRAQLHQRGMEALALEIKKATPACVECEAVTVEASREHSVMNFDEVVILRAKCRHGRCNKRETFKVKGEPLLPAASEWRSAPQPKPDPQPIERKPDVPATATDAW